MCGRFTLNLTATELAEFFDLFRNDAPVDLAPRYDIRPTQSIVTVRDVAGVRHAQMMRWGLVPSWADDLKFGSRCFNARSETVAEKPAFRSAYKARRCLIPASGFFEWQQITTKTKQKQLIRRTDGQPLALAGLWETWRPPSGEELTSTTILTTSANELMQSIHDRMPVILGTDVWSLWLNPKTPSQALPELMVPCPPEWLIVTAVNNKPATDGPECIQPIG